MNNFGFGTAKESPWRAGANENTVFKTTHDITIEGQELSAGTYGFHIVVNEDNTAKIIFSKNYGAWGSYFYEPSEDALQVDIATASIPHVEQLKFEFNEVDATSAVASLNWEKKQFPFKIEVPVTDIVLADIRSKMQNQEGFNRQTWEQAANFALNNGGDLDEAMVWIDAAIAGQFFSQKTFNNLAIKAQILMKQGKMDEAVTVMDEAMPLGTVFQVHGYGRQLIAAGQKEKALEVFQWNAKTHKNQWPVDYGLARGYSAVGDYKSALKHIKIAEGRAPDAQNKNAIAANLTKLEEGADIN
jgi:tetratricopeptide (TPR) repeat protein